MKLSKLRSDFKEWFNDYSLNIGYCTADEALSIASDVVDEYLEGDYKGRPSRKFYEDVDSYISNKRDNYEQF